MATNRQNLGALGAIAAGIGAAVLPWAKVASVFGSLEISGMDGDGKIALVLAVLALLAAASDQAWSLMLLGFVGAALMVYEWKNVSDFAGESQSGLAVASVGSGIYVSLAGFVLVLIAGANGESTRTLRDDIDAVLAESQQRPNQSHEPPRLD
jgi:hypothetical protein